jgi:hypothetical protein
MPSHPDPSLHSARPMSAKPVSSRPVSYVGTHHTDAPSNYDEAGAYLPEQTASSQTGEIHDGGDATDEQAPGLPRSNSHMSASQTLLPSRGGTLKKKPSLHKSASLKRTGSKRSSYAGSVRSMKLGEKEKYSETEETNSVFYCPVPTSGNPTELLANRFQGKPQKLRFWIAR